MILRYEQSTGKLILCDGRTGIRLVAIGYAGAACCVNSPAHEHEKGRGPLPKGYYTVTRSAHPRFAAPAFALRAIKGSETFGRSGFWIHGDNQRLDHTGSSGCIILNRDERWELDGLIRKHGIVYLEVVDGV